MPLPHLPLSLADTHHDDSRLLLDLLGRLPLEIVVPVHHARCDAWSKTQTWDIS